VTILEFPALLTGPTPDGQRDKLHADAFRDLEGPLCDCVHMARLAREKAANTKTDDGDLLFAIGHAAEMLEALQVAYIAAYEERKPIDR
jgi:hypothetical protein